MGTLEIGFFSVGRNNIHQCGYSWPRVRNAIPTQ